MTETKPPKRKNGRNTPDDIVVMRRERVMALRVRGLSLQEIYHTLSHKDLPGPRGDARPNPSFFPNPATGEGFDKTTLYRDIQWCERDALKRARRITDRHRAQQLAVLDETLRVAWSKGKLEVVLKTVELQAKLTGTIITKIERKDDDDQFQQAQTAKERLISNIEALLSKTYAGDTTDDTSGA